LTLGEKHHRSFTLFQAGFMRGGARVHTVRSEGGKTPKPNWRTAMKLKSIQHSSLWSVAFTSVVCLLGSSEASAGPSATGRVATVNYRDLNLSTIQGAITLYERLKGAARTVCDGPVTGVAAYQEWRSCYDAAIADAVAKVNSPLLTAVHRGPNKDATTIAMLAK
jgi:UrcA family protein